MSIKEFLCIDKFDSYHYVGFNTGDFTHRNLSSFGIKKEAIMVEVTKQATEQVAEYFKEREISPIRIFLHEGG